MLNSPRSCSCTLCPICHGQGGWYDSMDDCFREWQICPDCQGDGIAEACDYCYLNDEQADYYR